MSFTRLGLGGLVVTASLHATTALAAASQSTASGMQQKTTSSSNKAQARAKPRWASGDVQAIDAKALTLRNGEQLRLTMTTLFEQDGKTVSRDAVKPGERVKASTTLVGSSRSPTASTSCRREAPRRPLSPRLAS